MKISLNCWIVTLGVDLYDLGLTREEVVELS